ncbi:SulP family inorganic anion transporter [Sneathiella chinensis]|uniref:Sodium-independent anion transporter n=1 Tax=Sneathiella chinensis TaxID=349750 RepID=A0ABQ5U7C5_9PROT|nr:sulfate permease [Sneathiella chinensis]GLQ07696.1 sodium-independent anion transporter [Sneathiella chinensis]
MTELAQRLVPAYGWLKNYDRRHFSGDLTAGIITAILLIPQAMAYSALAGLPPEIGLYASIAPPLLYALFGSSRTLAVGPVAVASLMVAYSLSKIAEPGSETYIASAVILSFMVGVGFLLIALFRVGFMTEFLSHPVMSGFTSAAALVIAFSQLSPLVGLDGKLAFSDLFSLKELEALPDRLNQTTVMIGLGSVVLLHLARKYLAPLIEKIPPLKPLSAGLSKTGPLMVLILMTVLVLSLDLNGTAGVAIIGTIPEGLPSIALPDVTLGMGIAQDLLPSALLITLISYVESVAIAKVLASRRREKLDVNQEAWGLGFANLGSAFTGASPVCGGFSRSVVNFAAGANTQLAAIITATLIAATLVLFTPLFHSVPKSVLAAIILVAILDLVDIKGFLKNLAYDKADGIAQGITFVAVLQFGIEQGLIAGLAISLALHFWRSSRPHIAIVGQVGDTEHFRNVRRHKVRTYPHLLALRIDESLFFANTAYLENFILNEVAARKDLTDILLICSAINSIDGSALHTLEMMQKELAETGIRLHLAEVKGPVMDRLQNTEFFKQHHSGQVFLSTYDAFKTLSEKGNPLFNHPDWSI